MRAFMELEELELKRAQTQADTEHYKLQAMKDKMEHEKFGRQQQHEQQQQQQVVAAAALTTNKPTSDVKQDHSKARGSSCRAVHAAGNRTPRIYRRHPEGNPIYDR